MREGRMRGHGRELADLPHHGVLVFFHFGRGLNFKYQSPFNEARLFVLRVS